MSGVGPSASSDFDSQCSSLMTAEQKNAADGEFVGACQYEAFSSYLLALTPPLIFAVIRREK